MKKNLLIPGFAVAAGAVGLALRRWELATAFEPDTGLPIAGVSATWALALWSAAVAVILILLCRGERGKLDFDTAFAARGNTVYITAMVLAGFLLFTSAGAEIITYPITYQTIVNTTEGSGPMWLWLALPPLRIAFCVVGFGCVLLIGKNLFRGEGRGKEHLPLLGLCFLYCLWLISNFQLRAADPVVQDYLYEVLAICAGLVGIYEITTYSFQTGHPRRTLVLCLLGVYFSMVTLADTHTVAELLRFGFAILFLTAHAALLLGEHPAGESAPEEDTEAHENA